MHNLLQSAHQLAQGRRTEQQMTALQLPKEQLISWHEAAESQQARSRRAAAKKDS